MRIQLIIDLPDEVGEECGLPVVKRAVKSGVITELLASYRQRNGIRGQSSAADRYLSMLRERITVAGVVL